MKLHLNTAIAILCAVILSACDSDKYTDQGKLYITDMDIHGSNHADNPDVEEVDPYIDDGSFEMYIQSEKPALGYILRIYVNNSRSIVNAEKIYEIECDDDDGACYENDYFSIDCNYYSDMTTECGSDDQYGDLSPVIDQLPFSGYIVGQLCHRIQDSCTLEYERVIFR